MDPHASPTEAGETTHIKTMFYSAPSWPEAATHPTNQPPRNRGQHHWLDWMESTEWKENVEEIQTDWAQTQLWTRTLSMASVAARHAHTEKFDSLLRNAHTPCLFWYGHWFYICVCVCVCSLNRAGASVCAHVCTILCVCMCVCVCSSLVRA